MYYSIEILAKVKMILKNSTKVKVWIKKYYEIWVNGNLNWKTNV